MALSQESVISFQNQLTSIMEVLVKNAVFEITKLFESRMVEIQSVCVARREMKNASEFKVQQQLKTQEDEHEYHMNSQSTKTEFEARDEHVCTGTIDVFGRLVANSNDNITNTSTTLPGKQDNGNPLDQEFEQRWSSDLWQDGATLISGAGRIETQPVQVKQEVGQVKAGECCPACGKMPRSLGSLCTVCSDFSHQGAPVDSQGSSVSQPGSVSPARDSFNGNIDLNEPSDWTITMSLEDMATFDIRQILLSHSEGGAIVRSLDEDNCISQQKKNQMVRILVSHLMERFGETPTSQVKKALALSLVSQFPCLKDSEGDGYEVWYSQGRHHRPATGYLEERLRNIRKRIRRQSREGSSSGREWRLTNNIVIPETTIPLETVCQMKEWLKHNSQPLSQVQEYMRETAIYRANWIRQGSPKSVAEILQEYPHLLATPGMISQDFAVIYPGCADRLFESWVPVFAEKILLFASKEKMADICIQENSTGAMGDIAFKLLPIILLQPEYRTAKKMCRPSIDEAKKSFIDWIPASTDVTEYLRQTELERSHPFILQLGPARTFAVVHGQALEQGTLLTAVDVCFKAFHCFDINFPKQCPRLGISPACRLRDCEREASGGRSCFTEFHFQLINSFRMCAVLLKYNV
ncbi:hypothetical protein AGOR_G00047810 [Albula goreensis]|uniref:Uncharacterized protein n=1 Tax=Albula goreensis TaxID=1534307 RepID=A0A8T3E0Z1_9TELE|nr:hypothetical protein AGOR_G00047810 [Albula goreensis]